MKPSLKLDHFVVHIDEDEGRLRQLKAEAGRLGFPYRPERGKGTRSFKVSNMWIGDHYFELVWLRKRQTDWRKEWEHSYNRGKRGLFGLMLMTDDLHAVRKTLLEHGIPVSEPERISFKLFGFIKKSMPWQTIYAPPIPGTDLTIAISQMDSERRYEQIRTRYMKPNAEENGITGIAETIAASGYSDEAWRYIAKLFPGCESTHRQITIKLSDSILRFQRHDSLKQEVQIDLRAAIKGDKDKRAGDDNRDNGDDKNNDRSPDALSVDSANGSGKAPFDVSLLNSFSIANVRVALQRRQA